jgi:hypothetical protein
MHARVQRFCWWVGPILVVSLHPNLRGDGITEYITLNLARGLFQMARGGPRRGVRA